MKRVIPVSTPALVGNEKKYVLDCLDSTWISSCGKYVDLFEKKFAEFCKTRYAISCCNGTVALHLSLMALGVGPGDEIIVPTLTFVATANAVTYCGARPVFVDSDLETWNLDPSLLERLITPRTKGIIAVHLYGHPADMDPILEIARKYNLFLIEDAAEAHGAMYKGRKVGSLCDLSTFSFYGNKIITTGEGGMITTNREDLASKIYQLKSQGMDPKRRYFFTLIGYNYRLTNIAAAIGLAQLENIDWHLQRRREIASQYTLFLKHVNSITLQPEKKWARNVFWMNSILTNDNLTLSRDEIIAKLAAEGIETRPFFHPMHTLPMYLDHSKSHTFPIADYLAKTGINLPSSSTLSEEDVSYICDCVIKISENNVKRHIYYSSSGQK